MLSLAHVSGPDLQRSLKYWYAVERFISLRLLKWFAFLARFAHFLAVLLGSLYSLKDKIWLLIWLSEEILRYVLGSVRVLKGGHCCHSRNKNTSFSIGHWRQHAQPKRQEHTVRLSLFNRLIVEKMFANQDEHLTWKIPYVDIFVGPKQKELLMWLHAAFCGCRKEHGIPATHTEVGWSPLFWFCIVIWEHSIDVYQSSNVWHLTILLFPFSKVKSCLALTVTLAFPSLDRANNQAVYDWHILMRDRSSPPTSASDWYLSHWLRWLAAFHFPPRWLPPDGRTFSSLSVVSWVASLCKLALNFWYLNCSRNAEERAEVSSSLSRGETSTERVAAQLEANRQMVMREGTKGRKEEWMLNEND